MGLSLAAAMRLRPRSDRSAAAQGAGATSVAFVGAGGKTAAIFALAREFAGPVVITTTTHLGTWQLPPASAHFVAYNAQDLAGLGRSPISVVTGPEASDHRLSAPPPAVLDALRDASLQNGWPLLIEADGSGQRPLKAPAEHEPQVPQFCEVAVVLAGLSGLGRPLNEQTVHRPEAFARLSGLQRAEVVTEAAIASVLSHADGGLKGIPQRSRRIALLNQADTPERQAAAHRISRQIQERYDSCVIASLQWDAVHAMLETCAGIILAAGQASRFGSPKQLLLWKGEPLVRRAARQALAAGLSPVIVVTGANATDVESAVSGLPVALARNDAWASGQASSISAGLDSCPPRTGSAVFLLADQPFVNADVIRAVIDLHATESAPIVAPLIDESRRGNPVLFDRETFTDLRGLRADEGGRAVIARYPVSYVPWHDSRIVLDIDTVDDYHAIREEEA